MRPVLLTLSALLTIIGILPYLRDVAAKKTKPRLVSWFNWTLLTGIATAAAIADKQWPSAVLTASATLVTAAVVILGLRYGDTEIEPLDIFCQIGAIIGLILWFVFNSPLVALVMSMGIDLLVALPTYKHAWLKPHEETSLTFAIAAVSSLLGISAIEHPKLSGLIFPIYLFLANVTLFSLIKFSPNRPKN